jgi:hypothetical protein
MLIRVRINNLTDRGIYLEDCATVTDLANKIGNPVQAELLIPETATAKELALVFTLLERAVTKAHDDETRLTSLSIRLVNARDITTQEVFCEDVADLST